MARQLVTRGVHPLYHLIPTKLGVIDSTLPDTHARHKKRRLRIIRLQQIQERVCVVIRAIIERQRNLAGIFAVEDPRAVRYVADMWAGGDAVEGAGAAGGVAGVARAEAKEAVGGAAVCWADAAGARGRAAVAVPAFLVVVIGAAFGDFLRRGVGVAFAVFGLAAGCAVVEGVAAEVFVRAAAEGVAAAAEGGYGAAGVVGGNGE